MVVGEGSYIAAGRLSVRTVCRVREIFGRYKFGEEFALSKDGEGVHAQAPRSPLGRPGAGAFTRELGVASPCSLAEAESRPRLSHLSHPLVAAGLLTRVDPTPI